MLHAPRQTGKTSALNTLRDLFDSRAIGDFPLRRRERRGRPGGARRCSGGHALHPQQLGHDRRVLGDDHVEDVRPDIVAKSGPNNAWRHTVASFPPSRSSLGSHAMGVSSPASATIALPLAVIGRNGFSAISAPLTTGLSSSSSAVSASGLVSGQTIF